MLASAAAMSVDRGIPSPHISERNGGWGPKWALRGRTSISSPVATICVTVSENGAI